MHQLYILALASLLLFSCSNEKASSSTDSNDLTQLSFVDNAALKPNPYFIHLSDIHLEAFSGTSKYGRDTDTTLWNITKVKLQEIMSQTPAPSFVVYTGDLAAHYGTHYLPFGQRFTHNHNLETLLDDLRDLVQINKIPFLYLPGNNDALAGDYFSFADSTLATPFSLVPDVHNPYPALNATTNCGPSPCIVSNPHPTLGFYSARPEDSLRVLALNSVIFGREYKERDGISHDSAGIIQMDWISDQLKDAKAKKEKVILAMHIPLGINVYSWNKKESFWAHLPDRSNTWQDQFIRLTQAYKETITGILYGHTHMDEMRIIYNSSTVSDSSNITEVAISAPGITPYHGNNPGFKTITYDAKSKEIINFTTYYTTPSAQVYGDLSYIFPEPSKCNGLSILECVKNMTLNEFHTEVDKIYKVKHGTGSWSRTENGLTVLLGQ